MNIQEKKKELHYILDIANDELTNVLMETAVEYQTKSNEEFVVPQEWIDEAEQRSADLRSGKDKGLTLEKFKLNTEKILQKKINELHSYHNSTSK